MPADDERWLDGEAGPVVRSYALTGGRVPPVGGAFDLMAYVVAAAPGDPGPLPEHHAIVAACWTPVTVAEVAATLDLPVPVVRVLLADLFAAGRVRLYEPPAPAQAHDLAVLEAVVDGLRAL